MAIIFLFRKPEKVPGIPSFWVQIIHNVELLADMVKEYDIPILKHLADIQVEMMSVPMVIFKPETLIS